MKNCNLKLSNGNMSKLFPIIYETVGDQNRALNLYVKAMSLKKSLKKDENGEFDIEDIKMYIPELRIKKNPQYSNEFINTMDLDSHIKFILNKSESIKLKDGVYKVTELKKQQALRDISYINKLYSDTLGIVPVSLSNTDNGTFVSINQELLKEKQTEIKEGKYDSEDKSFSLELNKVKNIGNTVNEALNHIIENNLILAPLAKKFLENSPNIQIEYLSSEEIDNVKKEDKVKMKGNNVQGYFLPISNKIIINSDANINPKPEATILHEISHAITYDKIRNNIKEAKEWNKLYEEVKSVFIRNNSLTFDDNGFASIYPLSNSDEMLAGVFTNSSFIKLLKNTPALGKNYDNLWSKVLSFFKKVLGFDNKVTLYDEVFALGTQLIEAEDPYSVVYADDNYDTLYSITPTDVQQTVINLLNSNTKVKSEEKFNTINNVKYIRTTKGIQNKIINDFWQEEAIDFDEEDYYERKKVEINNDKDFEKFKSDFQRKFETASTSGTLFHEVFEETLKGETKIENTEAFKQIKNKYDKEIANKSVAIGEKIKDFLIKNHGPDAIILTEKKIKIRKDGFSDDFLNHIENALKSDEYSEEDKSLVRNFQGISGTGDVFVVLPNGETIIYDFKTSFKDFTDWNQSKLKSIRYQQNIYKKILESMGIVVGTPYILPINVEYDVETGIIEDINLTNGKVQIEAQGPSPLEGLQLNKTFKVSLPLTFKNDESAKKLIEFEEYFFGQSGVAKKFNKEITDEKIMNFAEKKLANNETEFYNYYITGKNAKVPLTKPDGSINKEGIREYFVLQALNNSQKVSAIKKYFKDSASAKRADSDYEVGIGGIEGGRKIKQFIDYYTDAYYKNENDERISVWEILDNPVLEEFNIITVYNKEAGVVEFITITDDDQNILDGSTTMLGKFEKNVAKALEYQITLEPKQSNVDAVKAFAYFMFNKEYFDKQNIKLGGVKVISIKNNQPFTFIDSTTLFMNFKGLVRYAKDKKVDLESTKDFLIEKMKMEDFLPDYKRFAVSTLNHIISVYAKDSMREKFKENLESSSTAVEVLKVLSDRYNQILSSANTLNNEKGVDFKTLQEDYKKELEVIQQAIIDLQVFATYQDYDLSGKMLTFNQNQFTTNPDDITIALVQNFVELQNLANRNMQRRIVKKVQDEGGFRDIFKNLFQNGNKNSPNEKVNFLEDIADGRNTLSTKFIGIKTPVYYNLEQLERVVSPSGEVKYKRTMKLRDPSKEGSYALAPGQKKLTPVEIDTINNLVKIHNQTTKERGIYSKEREFEIPLQRKDANSKFIQSLRDKGTLAAVKDYFNELMDDIINIDKVAGDDPQYRDRFMRKIEMTDMFSRQDNERQRNQIMVEQGEFEEDLELVYMMYLLNHVRKDEYDKILTTINAFKSADMLRHNGLMAGNNERTMEFIDLMIRNNIYNKKGTTNEDEEFTAKTTVARTLISNLAIGLSPRIGLVNFLTNSWATISSLYGINSDLITKKDYYKAMQFVIRDMPNNFSNVNALNYMSEFFGIHQMEVTKLLREVREDKNGIVNFSRWLQFLNSAPDFAFRMALFIGEGLTDGTMDIKNGLFTEKSAINFNGRGVLYNPMKDKRFTNYFEGNKAKDDYWREKALYDIMVEDLRKEFDSVSSTGDLKTPYTHKQIYGKLKRADLLYQEMSPENKTWFQRTSLGVLVTMFQTWKFSKKNLYYRNTGLDDMLGGYNVIEYEEKGVKRYIGQWDKKPMEGIYQSVRNYVAELGEHKNPVLAWKELTNMQRANIQHGITDMTIFAIITLVGLIYEEKDPKKKRSLENQLLQILYNSGRDMNIFNVIQGSLSGQSSSMFAVSYTATNIGLLYKAIQNPESAEGLITKVGVFKDIKNVTEGLNISSSVY